MLSIIPYVNVLMYHSDTAHMFSRPLHTKINICLGKIGRHCKFMWAFNVMPLYATKPIFQLRCIFWIWPKQFHSFLNRFYENLPDNRLIVM